MTLVNDKLNSQLTEQERNPELEYDEGGLHTIIGKCVNIEPVDDYTADDYRIISDDGVIYEILMNRCNMDEKYEMYPPQQKPELYKACIVKAEQLYKLEDVAEHVGETVWSGYSEISYIPRDAAHEAELSNSMVMTIINA